MSIFTDLHHAVTNENKAKILEILEEKDVDLKTTDDNGNTMLHLAFENTESNQEQVIEILEIFLDRGADINVKNKHGKTILHLAIERRMKDVLDFCLQRNADLNVKDEKGNSFAHFLIEDEYKKYRCILQGEKEMDYESLEEESWNFVDWMVSRGFDFFHTKNTNGESPLYLAAGLNLLHILQFLLKHVSDLAAAENDQNPLLCVTLQKYDTAGWGFSFILYRRHYLCNILRIILEKSQRVDDATLDTAYSSAFNNVEETIVLSILAQRIAKINLDNDCLKNCKNREERLAIARALIPKNADVNQILGSASYTLAIILFFNNPTIEMLEVLREAGANFNESNGANASNFLHNISTEMRNVNDIVKMREMIEFLVNEGGCDVNRVDSRNQTPLMHAIYQDIDVARKLIDCGAEINYVNEDGTTPFELACKNDNDDMVETFLEYGMDLTFRDKYNRTHLHIAVNHSATDVTKLLIERGADVNAKDKNGETPLHYVDDVEIAKILIDSGARINAVNSYGRTPLDRAWLSLTSDEVIDHLIRIGADGCDINEVLKNRGDRQFYTHAELDAREYLDDHLFKLIAADLCECPDVFKGHEDELQSEKFFQECLAEVILLKTYFLDDYTSLYKLLNMNRDRRCAYVDNEKLKNFVEDDTTNEEKFPNYFVLIVGCFNEASLRKSLLEQATDVLLRLAQIDLPDLCLDKIFGHLRNADLGCFIEATESE